MIAQRQATTPARSLTPVAPEPAGERVARAKRAFSTRNVSPLQHASGEGWSLLATRGIAPRIGDLVLARVDELGQHRRLELPDGRRASLYVGEEIVVAYGERYAPDQFEGVLPADLGPCDLLAAGGLAGTCQSASQLMDEPTRLTPIGLLALRNRRLNLTDFAVVDSTPSPHVPAPPVLAVVGTSMNSGKTTALAALVRGLTLAGLRVGAAKLTGTAAGGDLWLLRDAGATMTLDFTDAGLPSTYRVPLNRLEQVAEDLVRALALSGVDVIAVEVADGMLQPETSRLLASPRLRALVDGALFAASDAVGAVAGVERLRGLGFDVRAVTGMFTMAPLALREAAEVMGDLVVESLELSEPSVALRVSREHARAAGHRSAVAESA